MQSCSKFAVPLVPTKVIFPDHSIVVLESLLQKLYCGCICWNWALYNSIFSLAVVFCNGLHLLKSEVSLGSSEDYICIWIRGQTNIWNVTRSSAACDRFLALGM